MFLRARFAVVVSLGLVCSGAALAGSQNDPLERVNRVTYYVNNAVDKLYLKPAMIAYDTVLPMPAKVSVENFYSNIGTVLTIVNDLLQLRFRQFFHDTARFTINSTLGLAGIFDVATPMGLEYSRNDLGRTLYTWGWKESSYLIIPLIGPSTIRDGIGLFGELWLWPPSYLEPKWRNISYVTALINRRYVVRDLEGLIGVAGVANYELVRSGYLQNRTYVLTGKMPTENLQGQDMLGEPPD